MIYIQVIDDIILFLLDLIFFKARMSSRPSILFILKFLLHLLNLVQ